MDALEYLNEQKRMCKCHINCDDGCPMFEAEDFKSDCIDFIKRHPKKTVEIVEKWSKEHPIQSNRDKFIEVFGKSLNEFKAELKADYSKFWESEYKKPESHKSVIKDEIEYVDYI